MRLVEQQYAVFATTVLVDLCNSAKSSAAILSADTKEVVEYWADLISITIELLYRTVVA